MRQILHSPEPATDVSVQSIWRVGERRTNDPRGQGPVDSGQVRDDEVLLRAAWGKVNLARQLQEVHLRSHRWSFKLKFKIPIEIQNRLSVSKFQPFCPFSADWCLHWPLDFAP